MAKPILATTLRGLFVKSEPWKKAHLSWFEDIAKRLKDPQVKEYALEKPYFSRVDEVMKRLYPQLSEQERTRKARELFFDSVCSLLEKNNVKNEEVIRYFSGLKEKYQLALITGNKSDALEKILSLTGLSGFFDLVEASLPEEKDDKRIVFERFLRKYGKPVLYIGGDREDSFTYCREKGIPCVYANLEKGEEIQGVESVHNLGELRKRIEAQ